MKYLFSIIFFITGYVSFGQTYNPAQGTISNKPYAPAQAVPTDSRSYFYDAANFIWRPYQNTTEVNYYLNLPQYRKGNFPIYINATGTLNVNGTFTGGTINEYWYKNGVADNDLILKVDSSKASQLALDDTSSALRSIIFPKFNPIQGTNMTISGTYPNITFNAATGGGGGGSWGSISGTLSSQTDLQTALDLKAPVASPSFTGTVNGITKSMVGLSNVDNTSDINKPVSTSQQAALNLKANLASPTFTGTVSGITKSMVGLGNVDNTTDLNKPISTATQTALDAKQATLVSNVNIKTVDGNSLVGPGNIVTNGTTNLGFTSTSTNGTVLSSTGTSATVTGATSTNAGLMSAYDKRVIDSVFTITNAPGAGSNLLRNVDAFTTYARKLSITGGDTSASTPDVLSLSIVYPVTSVFGRTGIVAAQSGDYSAFYPLTSRTISTTSPLAGGGDLSANRTFSINTNGITYGLMQQGSANKLLGNPNGTTANLSEIGLGYGLTFSGTNLLIDSSKYATKWALDAAVIAAGGGVTTVFGRSGSVVAATNDYTWAQINKATSSLADITTRSAGDLSSGTLANARLTSDVVLKNAAIDLNAQTLTNFAANVNAQTGTTYTLVAGDMGKVITISNAAAITLTVPSGLPVGFSCTVIQKGAGQITFTASGTTIVNKSTHTKTSGQHAVTSLISDVSNNFYLGGDTSN